MSPDDFDGDPNNFTAPIPPHERQWRHPSELRDQSAPYIDAPPLQREFRLVAIGSACLSVVISLALLGVVSPRPPSVNTQEISALLAPGSNSLQIPDGSESIDVLRGVIPHLSDSTQPVVAMRRSGYFLSSALDMKLNTVTGIVDGDGRGITAQVVSIDDRFGIAWLRRLNIDSTYATKSLTISPPTTVAAKIAHGVVVWIIDRDVSTAVIGLSTKDLALTKHLWPIDSSPGSKLSGLAVDDQGNPIGWCVYVNGSQWVIPMAMLEDFLDEVDIASSHEQRP